MSQQQSPRAIKSTTLTLIITFLFATIYNQKIWEIYTSEHPFSGIPWALEALSFFVFLFFLLFSLFNLVSFKWIQRPVFALVFILSSAAMYFSNALNVYFDYTMIQNLFETDYREASELLIQPLVLSIVLLGLIPCIFIFKIQVYYKPWLKQMLQNTALSIISLGAALASAGPYYANHSSFIRNHNIALSESLLPTSYAISTASYLKKQLVGKNKVRRPIDAHPRQSPKWHQYDKPLALVFILGETARASSFSLQSHSESEFMGGIEKLFYYSNFSSCGTSTVVSVPCMFSTYSKDDFSRSMRLEYENVIDIALRSGFNTHWLDNHNGCKGVCEGIGINYVSKQESSAFFNDDQFFDEALVEGLADRITRTGGNQVRVLHQLGSHGPAYYKRVPEEFLVSEPSCRSSDLSQCETEAIKNTYNDTVRYTEYLIAKAIKELESISQTHDTVLIYVSDHGESTGENGLYLHGIPMFLAPQEQTHVPALVWLSDTYIASRSIDTGCLKKHLNDEYSHDNISHTLISLLDIESSAYQSELDILRPCKG